MSGALLAEAARPSFARHETFPLRFGWLRKAFTEADRNPQVFSQQHATVDLGVGKNMVNAIRYWAQAYKILEEQPDPDRPRVAKHVPTDFGRRLLAEDSGWDPWLEDTGSLWLLHWKLLSPESMAPAWWAAFNLFMPEQFHEQQLVDHLLELTAAAGWGHIVEASVRKDVDCLLRTFAVRRTGRQTMDDLLDCPARELGLLEPAVGESRSWRFVSGAKPALPPRVVAHACLDYMARVSAGDSNISVARLTSDPGSPGRAFRLTESALFTALGESTESHPALQLLEPGGLRQLVVHGPADQLADQMLEQHYARDVS